MAGRIADLEARVAKPERESRLQSIAISLTDSPYSRASVIIRGVYQRGEVFVRFGQRFLNYDPEVVPRNLETSRKSRQDEGASNAELCGRNPTCHHVGAVLISILLARLVAQRTG